MIEDYRKALSLGQKELKQSEKLNRDPYPDVLNDILPGEQFHTEKNLGILEIPLSLISGTCESARRISFSRSFYPLLEENTEFAAKWIQLYDSQMDEGIRDPIQVFEYRTRFYVREGNKRVSISRFLESPAILASVTRILPPQNDTAESRQYYEFVRYFELTHLYYPLFSEYGSYAKFLKALGRTWEDAWDDAACGRLKSVYHYYCMAYRALEPDASPEKIGDAFLAFLTIFPYQELCAASPAQIRDKLLSMKHELQSENGAEEVEHVLAPEEVKTPLMNYIIPAGRKQVRAAFLYDDAAGESDWVYAHELARHAVEEKFGDRVVTDVYENVTAENIAQRLEEAVAAGAQAVFTATPKMMTASIKAAIEHPEVSFFNCSLNFPYKTVRTYYARMYEAKFLTGIIAGIMSKPDEISYEAGYPIYGTVAEINAFARGVRMVRPEAKINLSWTCLREKQSKIPLTETIVSAKENISAQSPDYTYGLYSRDGYGTRRYATAEIDWSVFYSYIIQRLLNGTWKNVAGRPKTINYWWGISSGMLKVTCTEQVPEETRLLVAQFEKLISWGAFHPFEGIIRDRNGIAHGEAGKILTNEEIVTMNWLCENVNGIIPPREELNENAAELAELQGVETEA